MSLQPSSDSPRRDPALAEGQTVGSTSRDMRLKSGDIITVSGEPMRLYVFGEDEVGFVRPADMDDQSYRQFDTLVLSILKNDCAQIVARLGDRLLDSQDGQTRAGVEILIDNIDRLEPEFFAKIHPYLITLTKFGCNLHPTRGCVVTPPCSRAEFESALAGIPADSFNGEFNWNAWLDHAYDAVPVVTQGFYLYRSPDDRARLRASIPGFLDMAAELQQIFDTAILDGFSEDSRRQYDHLSRELTELEGAKLQPALSANADAQAMSTRVTIDVDDEGVPTMSSISYQEAFSTELQDLAKTLRGAARALPEQATELRAVLTAQAEWCVTPPIDSNWGQSLPIWIGARDRASVIDVNVVAEEKGSHLGSKAVFHIHVSQHMAPPAGLEEVWGIIEQEGAKKNVNTLLFRTLIVGGHTTHYTVSGEKLPDPAGQPQYKSMTFGNVAAIAQITAQAEAISTATGLPVSKVLQLKNIKVATVALHERGHTLGDMAEFLGKHGSSVEETNAQASAIYLGRRLLPDSVSDLMTVESCWMPIRRAIQGPTEPHSRSDIVLVEEYLAAGAIEITSHKDGHILKVVDPERLANTAYAMAIKMRLWELGLPEEYHQRFVEELNPQDSEQDGRIIAAARTFTEGLLAEDSSDSMRTLVKAEVGKFFANSRLMEIAAKLKPVLNSVKVEQSLTIIPSDHLLRRLVA